MSIQIDVGKEQLWRDVAGKMSRVTDKLGMTIDPGIMDTVVALNLLGIPTVQSCEGHIDHGIAAPWIFFTSPGIDDRPGQPQHIYEQNRQKHIQDQQKMLSYLDTFYANIKVLHDRMLIVYRRTPGTSVLESQGARCQFFDSLEEKAEKLGEYQEEMYLFTAFLKRMFFSS